MRTPSMRGRSHVTGSAGGVPGGGFPARRLVLRTLFTVGVVAGTAGALMPILARRAADVRDSGGKGPRGNGAEGNGAGGTGAAKPQSQSRPQPQSQSLERFAEMYQGRHIQGSATVMVPARGGSRDGDPAAGALGAVRSGRPAGGAWLVPSVEVRIDGRPLHVMRRADGTYLSLVNHYESFWTLRDVARAAVDELGDAQLSLTPMHSA